REARLGGGAGPHRRGVRGPRHAHHRRHHGGFRARRRVGGVLECLEPRDPAGVDSGVPVPRIPRPDDPQLHAVGAGAGVRDDGADQGAHRAPGRVAARPRQRDGPADHGRRPRLREPPRGLGADRDGLRLAGARAVHHGLAPQRGHERRPRGDDRGGHHLHRPQPALRSSLPRRGPACPMTAAGRFVTLRGWLLTETPASRRQARLGQAYVGWLAFRRNPLAMIGLGVLVVLLLLAMLAPVLTDRSPVTQDLGARLRPPGTTCWFGTDELGRDIYTRVLYGSRITLVIVVLVVILVAPTGLLIGTAAGYLSGWVDTVLMRVTDVFLAFPRLILALAFVSALGPGIENAVIAIACTAWPPYAR